MAHIFTPALRRPLSKPFARSGTRTLIQRAIASLRARGTDAHLWLPGVGTLNSLTTGNYLESTGNTVATVDNPTGLVLDALGAVGAELVTNGGPFVNTAGWDGYQGTLSVVNAAISVTATVANETRTYYQIPSVAGKTYKISARIVSTSTGSVIVGTNDTSGAGSFGISTTLGTKGAGETVSGYVVATNTNINLAFRSTSLAIGQTFAYDSVSVREVSGIHAQQATTASKPLLRRGLTNLLTYSSDFSNAAWVKNSITAVGSEITSSNTASSFRGVADVTAGQTYTFAISAKRGTMTEVKLSVYNTTAGNDIVAPTSYYSSIDGAAYSTVVVTFTAPAGCVAVYVYPVRLPGVTGTVSIASAGLFQGTLTAAQILAAGGIPVTTTAAASNPDEGKYSWAFDGSNDSLALGSVPFQMGDDHFVTAAFSVNSVAVSHTVFGVSSSATANPLICYLEIYTPGRIKAMWRSDAGAVAEAALPADSLVAHTKYVITAAKVGSTYSLWINGVLGASTSATLGVTTANTANIGALVRTTTTNYLNGTIYYLSPVKGTLTESDRNLVEKLAASAAGITI